MGKGAVSQKNVARQDTDRTAAARLVFGKSAIVRGKGRAVTVNRAALIHRAVTGHGAVVELEVDKISFVGSKVKIPNKKTTELSRPEFIISHFKLVEKNKNTCFIDIINL